MAVPAILDAHQFRLLAEEIASRRAPHGERTYLVPARETQWEHLPVKVVPPSGEETVPAGSLLELDTRDQQPRRPRVHSVVIDVGEPGEERRRELSGTYDAVFWSEAAVEKFVLPYYASKSLWFAAHVLGTLSKIWYGFVPGAEPANPDADDEVPTDLIPFALAHLPSSDYVGIAEDGLLPGSDLHLLFRGADGTVQPRALSEFLSPEMMRRATGL